MEAAPLRGPAPLLGNGLVAGVDRADRLEDAVDVGRTDQAIVGTDQASEPVADGPLEVAQDLGPVGIVVEAGGGSVEVPRKPVVGVSWSRNCSGCPLKLMTIVLSLSPLQFVDQ